MLRSLLVVCLVALCCVTSVDANYNLTKWEPAAYGFTGELRYHGDAATSATIRTLEINVYYDTENRLRVRIGAPGRFEVPAEYVKVALPTTKATDPLYEVTKRDAPFSLQITRRSDGAVLLNTTGHPLVFENLYMSLTHNFDVATPRIYGLGERIDTLPLPLDNNFSMWAHDAATPEHLDLYGSYPVYYSIEANKNVHGVYLFNSNAVQVNLKTKTLQWRVLGGIFDLFFFMGPTMKEAVSQYTDVVGKPFLPPAWSLGFHQCRWGYESVAATQDVVQQYEANDMPLDAIWNDIDYMQEYFDFTWDSRRYKPADMANFRTFLDGRDQHHVCIVDPGIPARKGYGPYTTGEDQDVFIRSPENSTYLRSRVWPAVPIVFPDFSKPASLKWWEDAIQAWFTEAGGALDGLWIDMNEPASFCFGQIGPGACRNVTGPPFMYVNSTTPGTGMAPDPVLNGIITDNGAVGTPPFMPQIAVSAPVHLAKDTINMSAIQHIGRHYNTHNLYGFQEMIATQLALKNIQGGGRRTFVLTRSGFSGVGSYGAHWTGDNFSTFKSMADTIKDILALGIQGSPMVGSDVCGFMDNTTAELCTRWAQLGIFYPFFRNHNIWDSIAQEFYVFDEPHKSIMRTFLYARYQLLAELYTLTVESHLEGTPLMRPMVMEFSQDVAAFALDAQFMLGDALLVAPVLTDQARTVSAYLPMGEANKPLVWYNYWTGEQLPYNYFDLDGPAVGFKGLQVNFAAPLDSVPVSVLGGKVLSVYHTPTRRVKTTLDTPLHALVYMDPEGKAAGRLYMDDGDLLPPEHPTTKEPLINHFDFEVSTVFVATVKKARLYSLRISTTKTFSNVNFNMGQRRYNKVTINGVGWGASDPSENPPPNPLEERPTPHVFSVNGGSPVTINNLNVPDKAVDASKLESHGQLVVDLSVLTDVADLTDDDWNHQFLYCNQSYFIDVQLAFGKISGGGGGSDHAGRTAVIIIVVFLAIAAVAVAAYCYRKRQHYNRHQQLLDPQGDFDDGLSTSYQHADEM